MKPDFKKELKEQYKNRMLTGGVYRVTCRQTGQVWLRMTKDLQGSKNRFHFFVLTDSCPEGAMMNAWKQYGSQTFAFEVVEELRQKETQTEQEFTNDLELLLTLWAEKLSTDEGGK